MLLIVQKNNLLLSELIFRKNQSCMCETAL